jgi:hypothetical protein
MNKNNQINSKSLFVVYKEYCINPNNKIKKKKVDIRKKKYANFEKEML